MTVAELLSDWPVTPVWLANIEPRTVESTGTGAMNRTVGSDSSNPPCPNVPPGAAIPPESFDPGVGTEWISLLRSTVGGEGEGVIGPIASKGCIDRRLTGGVVCGYLGLSRAPQVGGAEGLATLALYEADGNDNAVPIPGTLVLFGLGLASLGASRRRR